MRRIESVAMSIFSSSVSTKLKPVSSEYVTPPSSPSKKAFTTPPQVRAEWDVGSPKFRDRLDELIKLLPKTPPKCSSKQHNNRLIEKAKSSIFDTVKKYKEIMKARRRRYVRECQLAGKIPTSVAQWISRGRRANKNNRIGGAQERCILEALGLPKNSKSFTKKIMDGKKSLWVTTIPDALTKDMVIDIKSKAQKKVLYFTRQLRAQYELAKEMSAESAVIITSPDEEPRVSRPASRACLCFHYHQLKKNFRRLRRDGTWSKPSYHLKTLLDDTRRKLKYST